MIPRGRGPRVVTSGLPIAQVRALLDRDPVASVFAAEHVEAFARTGALRRAPLLGLARSPRPFPGLRGREIELSGLCWAGTNVVPVALDRRELDAVADRLVAERQGRASVFGVQELVMPLWERMAPRWSRPFAVREDQPLLVLRGAPSAAPHPAVRLGREHELDLVRPASAAMFLEEVGFSPDTGGAEAYTRRVQWLLRQRRTYVLVQDGQVAFKADLGAVHGDVCQIQGVWVRPELRGQGLSVRCMAAVAQHALTRFPVVSLYVNAFNEPALRSYRRVGFRQEGAFATVLL